MRTSASATRASPTTRGCDIGRLLPDGFLEEYARLARREPSPALRDFLEAYELLQDVLYHGTRIREDTGKVTGGGDHEGFWFGDDSLLGLKGAVDRRLAQTATHLRSWAKARARQAAGRRTPPPDDRGDLARARVEGHHGPVEQAEREA
jgi:hypothetical protein